MIHGYHDVQVLERRKIGETERGQSANQTTRGGKEKGSRSCYTFLEPVLSIVVADIAVDAPISSADHLVVDVPIADVQPVDDDVSIEDDSKPMTVLPKGGG